MGFYGILPRMILISLKKFVVLNIHVKSIQYFLIFPVMKGFTNNQSNVCQVSFEILSGF